MKGLRFFLRDVSYAHRFLECGMCNETILSFSPSKEFDRHIKWRINITISVNKLICYGEDATVVTEKLSRK